MGQKKRSYKNALCHSTLHCACGLIRRARTSADFTMNQSQTALCKLTNKPRVSLCGSL